MKDKIVRGFFFVGSARLAQQLVSWAINIFIARLLAPTDYGLMALANLFIYFASYFYEVSIGDSIVQKRDLGNSYLNSAFWTMMVFSALCLALSFLLSDVIAGFFDEVRLSDVLKLMGVNFVVAAFGVVPSSILARELRFPAIAKINVVSDLCMGVSSLVLAAMGYGVWSLVAGSLLRSFLYTALVVFATRWTPGISFSLGDVRHITAFGLPLTGSKIINTVVSNADNFFIGKMLGGESLGYYSMALRLSVMPVVRFSRILSDVNLPVFARFQAGQDMIRNYFIKSSRYSLLVAVPALLGLMAVADEFVLVALGVKWSAAVFPLKILCVIGILKTVYSTMSSLLIGMGRTDAILRYQVLAGLLLPLSFFIGARFGLNGVACAWVIAYPPLIAYLLGVALKGIGLTFRDYLEMAYPILLPALVMLFAVHLFRSAVAFSPLYRMVGSISTGIVTFLAMSLLMNRPAIEEIRDLVTHFRTKQTGS